MSYGYQMPPLPTHRKLSGEVSGYPSIPKPDDITAEGYKLFSIADDSERYAQIVSSQKPGIPTKIHSVDSKMGGLRPGNFILLAARPSMGKTSLAVQMILNMASSGKFILFCSLETDRVAIYERFLANLSGVHVFKLRDRSKQSEVDSMNIKLAEERMSKMNILICENFSLSSSMLRSMMGYIKKEYGRNPDAVFVDYLQIMDMDNSRPAYESVTLLSKQVKAIANEYKTPFVILSQLNRQSESRDNKQPTLADLRGSGSLEQDADVVILLHREDYYRERSNDPDVVLDGMADCIIAKNRQGPTGLVKLAYLREIFAFEEA